MICDCKVVFACTVTLRLPLRAGSSCGFLVANNLDFIPPKYFSASKTTFSGSTSPAMTKAALLGTYHRRCQSAASSIVKCSRSFIHPTIGVLYGCATYIAAASCSMSNPRGLSSTLCRLSSITTRNSLLNSLSRNNKLSIRSASSCMTSSSSELWTSCKYPV